MGLFYYRSENRRYVANRGLAGGIAEAAIDGVTETSDSMTNTAVIFVAYRYPGGEMTVEKLFVDHIFTDSRGRDFRSPNRWFVSRRGTSLDPGTDVSYYLDHEAR